MSATTLPRESPLGAHDDAPFPLIRAPGLEIDERAFLAHIALRMPPSRGAFEALEATIGVPLPEAGRLTATGDWFGLAIWLGPDEWLIVESGDAGRLEDRLRAAPAAHGATTVDVSAQRTLLELRGTAVHGLLSAGCSVDLDPRTFAVGSAVQTMLARVDVIIGRAAADIWLVAVRSSFAPYLLHWLRDAVVD